MSNTISQLANELGHRLLALDARITVAESCTGGLLAAAITEVPGSSQWFDFGFVTYSNQAKQRLLSVDPQLFCQDGAVSEPVVKAMAEGARKLAQADYAIAVSGIAGPGGGTSSKPVGTVWLAWSCGQGIFTQSCCFPGSRYQVREASVQRALFGLVERLPQKTV